MHAVKELYPRGYTTSKEYRPSQADYLGGLSHPPHSNHQTKRFEEKVVWSLQLLLYGAGVGIGAGFPGVSLQLPTRLRHYGRVYACEPE